VFSFGEKNIYFYKQAGKLKVYARTPEKKYSDGIVKGFPIEIIKEVEIKNCPLVLASIKSSKYISLGTFKKLSAEPYYGNILAIEYILTGQKQIVKSYDKYLQCLSSMGFETLIAKMYEEQGYFVSSYRGGTTEKFDLFCKKADKTLSLQIKLK
jgi:hypothetical protein